MNIDRLRISTDFNGEVCFTHARAVILDNGFGIMTAQPLRLSGCDVFYGIYISKTHDGGKSWSKLAPSKTLVRRKIEGGVEIAFCDATPIYHKKSGKILLVGHHANYVNDNGATGLSRSTAYAVYDEALSDFSEFELLDMGGADEYFSSGSGSSQYLECENGDILIPFYHMGKEESLNPWGSCYKAAVLRASFDGERLSVCEIGTSVSISEPRGLYEPSLVKFNGKYFLALRNDLSGYVAVSSDGLNFSAAMPLVWENGKNVGNYNTQQHWLTLGDKLYMVYTRRADGNDNVFRHRAPLFIAEFDTKRICLIRESEKIAVPNRGARLGNFGCQSRPESADAFIFVSEWMQTTEPDQTNYKRCMEYGSDNSIFVVHVS